jgi:hypothetical protein
MVVQHGSEEFGRGPAPARGKSIGRHGGVRTGGRAQLAEIMPRAAAGGQGKTRPIPKISRIARPVLGKTSLY